MQTPTDEGLDAATAPAAPATPAIPQTARERGENALRFAHYLLQQIDAPASLAFWPRRDQDAWMEVVGRPRIDAWVRAQGLSQALLDEKIRNAPIFADATVADDDEVGA